MTTLEILLFVTNATLLFFNIYDHFSNKKLLEKHIRHIDEQAEYIRKLEHDLRNLSGYHN